jgi:serine/threonine protein kinase
MEFDATACARLINEAISLNTKVERDRLANEERDQLAKRERIEREQLAKEERDRRERLAKEESDRLAQEESDRLAKEEIIERERLDRENNERELQEIVLIDVERDVFYCDGKIVTDLRYIDRIILGRCPSSIRDGDDQVFIKYAVCGRDLDREVDALRLIESPDESLGNYAVKLLSESLPRYIVLEPFGICLREFLTKVSSSSLNHLQAVEVTRAVNWLHSKHLIHGDITPHNILVKLTQTGSYQVKLCDFDNCRHFGNPLNYSLNKIRFSRPWVCPEVFFYWQGIDRFGNSIPASQDLRATPEMDYFSLGLVLACVLDKERSPDMTLLPFSSDDKTLRDYFISESYLSRISCSAVPLCRESIRKLCSFSPNSRGHLSELISLLDSLRYSNLQQRLIHLEENAAIGDRIETALCDQTQTLASLHHKSAER